MTITRNEHPLSGQLMFPDLEVRWYDNLTRRDGSSVCYRINVGTLCGHVCMSLDSGLYVHTKFFTEQAAAERFATKVYAHLKSGGRLNFDHWINVDRVVECHEAGIDYYN